jgi:NTP pyrophosphatase (non-canonical NTP hydrolase)
MERSSITLQFLQAYIRKQDHQPDKKLDYVLKLMEEVGELAEAVRKDVRMAKQETIKGTVEEELYDVLYYVLAVANIFGVDMEQAFILKDEINQKKYSYKLKGETGKE